MPQIRFVYMSHVTFFIQAVLVSSESCLFIRPRAQPLRLCTHTHTRSLDIIVIVMIQVFCEGSRLEMHRLVRRFFSFLQHYSIVVSDNYYETESDFR